jgi:NTE family protein
MNDAVSQGQPLAARPGAGPVRKISLALQGGGAHGAFTWGVLDALLEDGRIEIEAISGTSAGAMNAVVLGEGLLQGGPAQARAQLERFWRTISDTARLSPVRRSLWQRYLGQWSVDESIGFWWLDWVTRYASPYEFNPLNINPLRDALEQEVDFRRVREDCRIKIFVTATNVFTGKIRVFERQELTASHVLASGCLPQLFQAVEIEGEPYWDGGFMGNPALFPLFYGIESDDVLLVQVNPIERREVPRTARDIQNRLNEITFNSSLLRELRAVEFVRKLIVEEKLPRSRYKQVLMHRIAGAEELKALAASSKLNTEWEFLLMLKSAGRRAAQEWLAAHFDDLGVRSTLDISETLR